MKVKQRSTCQTCRKRKLGCDGKRPGCSQCVLTGRECDGYNAEWTFVAQNTRFEKSSSRDLQKVGVAATLPVSHPPVAHQSPPDALQHGGSLSPNYVPPSALGHALSDWDSLVGLVITSYIPENELPFICDNSDNSRYRICGSWMEVLPELTAQIHQDSILRSAMKALATSILASTPHQSPSNLDPTQHYYAAIRALRIGIAARDPASHAEVAASIMCLSLTEVMFRDSAAGLSTHIKGVSQLLQTRGAEQYKSGVLHKLFVGFRPLLITEAFRSRQPTILASEEWIQLPFSIYSPSLMHILLNKVAIVPTYLHQIDEMSQNPSQTDPSEITALFSSLANILVGLENWETSLQHGTDGPCYWPRITDSQPKEATPQTEGTALWFPNVTMANVFTHMWTFRIICMTELEKLALLFPWLILGEMSLTNQCHLHHVQEHTLALSDQICSSMEYLLQDEMKLFGPASTFVPLKTVYHKFKADGSRQMNIVARCQAIVNRLVEKGLLSAPIIVFGE
ncbi:hypothetical protein VF21_05052 [Pseudogymnoascus sp. 05NY08]|nr:hypothetical protein VF21_05052 [Pseudogymnoascus sp. 05NY08]